MNRYETMFANLAAKNQVAFVPFVVLGDPSVDVSMKIIEALIEGGADALELGIPFSDPIADGPVIQAAAVRALESGTTPDTCFDMLATIRKRHPDLPIGLLIYANLAVVKGPSTFYRRAAASGVDSVLIADMPVSEAAPFVAAAKEHGIQPVFIAPPTASASKLREIAQISEGYTYVVARAGVTGVDENVNLTNSTIFNILKDNDSPPAMIGFGISKPAHVQAVLKAGAAGAISGSAVVNLIQKHRDNEIQMLSALRSFVQEMKIATHC